MRKINDEISKNVSIQDQRIKRRCCLGFFKGGLKVGSDEFLPFRTLPSPLLVVEEEAPSVVYFARFRFHLPYDLA